MTPLTVLTPVTRPENLARVGASLEIGRALFNLEWWVVRDEVGGCPVLRPNDAYKLFNCNTPTAPWAYGRTGEWVLNTVLPDLKERPGLAWMLADDNMASPEFFADLYRLMEEKPESDFIMYPQNHDGVLFEAAEANVCFQHIDGGQYLYTTALIGNLTYSASIAPDCDFAEDLLRHAYHPVFRPGPVLPYNALRSRDPR